MIDRDDYSNRFRSYEIGCLVQAVLRDGRTVIGRFMGSGRTGQAVVQSDPDETGAAFVCWVDVIRRIDLATILAGEAA